jgi:hypothetical protein
MFNKQDSGVRIQELQNKRPGCTEVRKEFYLIYPRNTRTDAKFAVRIPGATSLNIPIFPFRVFRGPSVRN